MAVTGWPDRLRPTVVWNPPLLMLTTFGPTLWVSRELARIDLASQGLLGDGTGYSHTGVKHLPPGSWSIS